MDSLFVAINKVENQLKLEDPVLFSGISEHGRPVGKQQLLIAGLAQNVEQCIPALIDVIEATGAFFMEYTVVLVENDSKDKTRYLLENWASNNPRIHLLTPSSNLPFNRIQKMTVLRNMYIEYAINSVWDIMLITDTDLVKFWDPQIVVELSIDYSWDVLTAFGTDDGIKYSDLYAYRDEFYTKNYSRYNREELDQYICDKIRKDRVRVTSAFGWMGVYRKINNKYCANADECEHVYFHRNLIVQIEPKLRVQHV